MEVGPGDPGLEFEYRGVAMSGERIAYLHHLAHVGERALTTAEHEALREQVRGRDRLHRFRHRAFYGSLASGLVGGVAYAWQSNDFGDAHDPRTLLALGLGGAVAAFSFASAVVVAALGATRWGRWAWRGILGAFLLGISNPGGILPSDVAMPLLAFGGLAIGLGGAVAGVSAFFTDRAYASVREPLGRDVESRVVWLFAPPRFLTLPGDDPEFVAANREPIEPTLEYLPASGLVYSADGMRSLDSPKPVPVVFVDAPTTHVEAKRPMEREVARDVEHDAVEVERPLAESERDDIARHRERLLGSAAMRGLASGWATAVVLRMALLWVSGRTHHELEPVALGMGALVFAFFVLRALRDRRRIDADLHHGKVHYVRDADDGTVIVEFLPLSRVVLSLRGVPAAFRTDRGP